MASLFSIDAHAAGGACRLVYAGFPLLWSAGVESRHDFVRARLDWIRTSLMHEPRGHPGAFGALMLPPEGKESIYSLLFFDPAGYLNGCGHGTLCSVAVWRRMVGDVAAGAQIENPDGSSTAVLSASGDGESCSTSLLMPATTVLAEHGSVPWNGGTLDITLVRSGNTYVLVDADDLAARDRFAEHEQRVGILTDVRAALAGVPGVPSDTPVEILAYRDQGNATTYETTVLFSGTQLDRSPCGTGTCALASLLTHRGQLGIGEWIETRGPAGLPFRARVDQQVEPGSHRVRLEGTAYITGVHEWVVSAQDPLRSGVRVLGAGGNGRHGMYARSETGFDGGTDDSN